VAVVAVVEAAEADATVVETADAFQMRIIAKPRGSRVSHAGRSRNRL